MTIEKRLQRALKEIDKVLAFESAVTPELVRRLNCAKADIRAVFHAFSFNRSRIIGETIDADD